MTYLFDIECFRNYFCLGLENYDTGEKILYEISEERDDRENIRKFCSKYKGFLVSANGLHYDEIVLAYFVKTKNLSFIPKSQLLYKLKQLSDAIINDNFSVIKPYKWTKYNWTSIDLFCYWAKSLRMSKQISLKSLAVQLRYPVIQNLPFDPDSVLTKEQLPKLRHYNLEHDLGVLRMLYDAMKKDVELRGYIKDTYGLSCWSMDAPKITSEYLLEDFCRKTYKDKTIPYYVYKKHIREKRYFPKPWKIGEYLPNIQFKTKIFQDLLEEIKNSDNTFSKQFYFEEGVTRVTISMGKGGIHTKNENEIYKCDDKHLIIDQDILSLYPTLLDVYKLIRKELTIVLDKYLDIKKDRVEAKREGNKIKDLFLKLCLNG